MALNYMRVKLLFWAILTLCFDPGNCRKYVFCNSLCGNNPLSSVPSVTCNHERPDRVPWSSTEDVPAVKPTWISSSWYTYDHSDGRKGIALNLTWTQSADIFKLQVKGYYINIGIIGAYLKLKKNVYTFNKTTHLKGRKKIYFNSICIGRDHPKLLLPGKVAYINLHALPMYQEHSDDQSVSSFVNIPACSEGNKEIDSTTHCQRLPGDCNKKLNDSKTFSNPTHSWEDQAILSSESQVSGTGEDFDIEEFDSNSDDEKYESDSDYTKHPVEPNVNKDELFTATIGAAIAVAVGGFVVVLILIVILCVLKRIGAIGKPDFGASSKCLSGADKGSKSCFVLISTTNTTLRSTYSEATGLLAKILQLHGGLEVECNLFQLTEMDDPKSWTSEKLKKFEHVVLVCTPDGKRNLARTAPDSVGDPFVMAMRVYMKRCATRNLAFDYNQTFTIVYFDRASSLCVPDEVAKTSEKCHRLMMNFKDFFSGITGRKSNVVPPEELAALEEYTDKIVTSSMNIVTFDKSFLITETRRLTTPAPAEVAVPFQSEADDGKLQSHDCPHGAHKGRTDVTSNSPFDSGFSANSKCTCDSCDASSSPSCDGSQCSCMQDSMLSSYPQNCSQDWETKL